MKKRYLILIVVFVVLVIGLISAKIVFDKIEENLNQLVLLEITDIDLSAAGDGTYIGSYSSFPVSAEVEVTIKDHIVVGIELLKHNHGKGEDAEFITENIIGEQSLNVDVISGATYSSKVILKAVEDALLKATTVTS